MIKEKLTVDEVMKLLNITTNKELSELSGVSEKTIIGWKKKLSPMGKVVLTLLVEKDSLKKDSDNLKKLKEILKT